MSAGDIRFSSKKLLASSILVTIILLNISPIVNSENYSDNVTLTTNSNDEKELHLLRVEHVLVLKAAEDADTFNLRYVFPPDYQYQVPIFLEILDDSSANILNYQIEDDINEPNKVVNFTIGYMNKEDSVLIHFSCWVLVKNHEYCDLPEYVEFPKNCEELPEDTKTWLSSTDVVQTESFLIKIKANQLRSVSNNLIRFASKIAPFIKEHNYLLFVLQLNLGIFFSQDAITTLLINGENVGRSHLGCALFRANNVPARVLLALPDQTFWTQMHYMFEYYCPDYGWILIDPTRGKTPYEPRRQVINRVCYPSDENDTKADYIIPLMNGEERWLWINNENVYPYYVDCEEGSKSKMFSENKITTDSFTADYTFLLTQIVFHQYEHCLGGDLVGENLNHFQKATCYQKQALSDLCTSVDPFEYIFLMDKAYNEYREIVI